MLAARGNWLQTEKLEVSSGFLFLLAWLNFTDGQGLLEPTIIAASAHELGHWAVAKLLNGNPVCIRLSVVGAEMILQAQLSYFNDILCSLAGPGMNLMLAFLSGRINHFDASVFAAVNLLLGVFNLLPVCQLDGGRVLTDILFWLLGPDRGVWVKEMVDLAIIGVCLLLGFLFLCVGGNSTLLVVALWLAGGKKKVTFKRVVKGQRNR